MSAIDSPKEPLKIYLKSLNTINLMKLYDLHPITQKRTNQEHLIFILSLRVLRLYFFP